MTSIAFDTLNASTRLREAGMDERTAKAIVEIVSQTASLPDTSNVATKHDLQLGAAKLESYMDDKLRHMTLALLGGTTAIVGVAVAILKLP